MKRLLNVLTALAFVFFAAVGLAAPAAVVEGVQMPAWMERGGIKIPLAPGMELRPRDELHTGTGARLYVKLAEGSLIKLGENGSLKLLDMEPQKGGFFKGAMDLFEGAFRFTTDKVLKRGARDINVKVATVTIGIRGTDLWGRSKTDNEIVCLIEGRIDVGAQNEQAVTMDKPLQFYKRENGKTQPVAFVSPDQLKIWAAETDIEAGRGAARRGGRWSVTLASVDTQEDALKLYDDLRANGYAAQIRPRVADGKTTYRVQIRSLPSQPEAASLAKQLLGKFGIKEPIVSL